ncbi:MAG: VCBS repeat-containing protein [Chitinophagaceae bacterium]|nr:VCBS repeat-containing protein [Chitinophagaceae bacterium]
MKKFIRYVWIVLTIIQSCKEKKDMLFSDITDGTGIEFSNLIEESEQLHILNFEYMYNGGGVAIGDVNNDGLQDIYFSANQLSNKLYLNKGDLHFEDITETAGVAGKKGWKTGVMMADVNGDGLMDMYVCYSGKGDKASRSNQLFINKGLKNGKPVFADEAASFGLDAPGSNSTQAAFFDYDRDGDLDMFLLNHATTFYSPLFNVEKLRTKRHPYFSNYLFRNDNGKFTNVSASAGIRGGGNNFGLGVCISDLNNDGWVDIYTTNDYEEQDFLYINNCDGSFRDVTKQSLSHISKSGMGCDISDFNNDGLMDIIVADMLPEDNKRQKLLLGPDEYDRYNILVDSGYFHQNMRNTLQCGQGIIAENIPVFSEIAQLCGVSNTDWSWSTLFADFDNDGYKDIFFTNGYWRDYTNRDFLSFNVQEYRDNNPGKSLGYDLVKQMSQTKISNYIFKNDGNLKFVNQTSSWGLNAPGVSNGASYVDLDNDGDLDIVVNNLGSKASVYRNNTEKNGLHNFLRIQLQDTGLNRNTIGARIAVETGSGKKHLVEMSPVRGFQSSVDPVLHVGLGADSIINRIVVTWPDGNSFIVHDAKINTTVKINREQLYESAPPINKEHNFLLRDITQTTGIDFVQHENQYVDFKYEFLLPWQLSKQGPKLSKADVNNDGLEDIFIGAPKGQVPTLFIQNKNGRFSRSSGGPWVADSLHEDMQSVFFDADGDGDNDLYVVSGGNELHNTSEELQDRLYINDGKGNFSKYQTGFPNMNTSKYCVAAADYNRDGRIDLFVGGRLIREKYGISPESYLLKNDAEKGVIKFSNVVNTDAKDLQFPGMITCAVWHDVNDDGWPDLMIAGEWMPVKLYINNKGKLEHKSADFGLEKTNGLWTSITPADIDNDGDLDFLLGNLAPNTQLHASMKEPMTLCINDYLQNGTSIPVLNYFIQGVSYPYPSRDEMAEPAPAIKKKFLHYADYANAALNDIFSSEQRVGMTEQSVYSLKNCWLKNDNNHFTLTELPVAAQFSPIQAAIPADFDKDGRMEVFAAGNFYPFRVQLGREDAGKGILLKMKNGEGLAVAGYSATGVMVEGDVRDMITVNTSKGKIIIVAKNNAAVQVLQISDEFK